ncbi:pimeloyl-ACP methyl ester carboxylesterase [Streptomyces sp. 1114.5]|uniref:alpha/beta fold hydrolase n=1 Tax=unclassified Streptomyces TaxID=2593676 RepID=UPI000BD6809C|nr:MULTISPECIES: alpha/beta hydrolase [unclassified Streptomyces]RKT19615.1 pimeloyl-ACP methyl ester carboxylesterase [Streptomyces sp. 1114.5]SOB85812.1 Pimeloyl-ACP methyl ester carboxylesterase [Streptomyces sp. 1331.2]
MGSSVAYEAIKHSEIEVNGVRLHLAEQGEGPLVLLLHGFPESWYSWRHQFAPLAAAGYRVVAPDQRGYARSEQPENVDAYSLLHLVGDVTALIRALGEEQAVVIGHDWGAPVAWATAALRPDLVRGVAGLSVPPLPVGGPPPLQAARAAFGEGFYQIYFQEPGRADAELAADVKSSLRRILSGKQPDGVPRPWIVPAGGKLLDTIPEPERLPDWLTDADLDAFTAEYDRHGERAFTGGLNWYRNLDRNAELLAAFTGLTVEVPALFIVGEQDLVNAIVPPEVLTHLLGRLPKLRGHVRLPDTGHWTQQERPAEVNEALLGFLKSLD